MFRLSAKKPFSLRTRFLLATALVVLVLSLSWGMVAVIGYAISFDKNTYQVMRGESNLFYTLAQWRNNQLSVIRPEQIPFNAPTLVFIYDAQGKLLWQQRDVADIRRKIRPEWLKKSAFHEIVTSYRLSRKALGNNPDGQEKLRAWDDDEDDTFTHSVAVNCYRATASLPALIIVIVDSIPQELQHADIVWSWFSYVLLVNLLLVIPLLWQAAHWSLRPIGILASQIRELETGQRETLDAGSPQELRSLVRNLNLLLHNERQRYSRYRTTLADLAHSLKTPLAVLQSTLRLLHDGKSLSTEQAEPIMQEQIDRISQQTGYYLRRASLKADHHPLKRETHAVVTLMNGLCSALNKVYQHKGVALRVNISPETTFIGDRNDFMGVMGNVLDNACKYCLEFVEIGARQGESDLLLLVEDDGPGIAESQRETIFLRGQRADTLRPGQGLGLAVARDILEQYAGDISASTSTLGGACMAVRFQRQGVESGAEQ